VRAIVERDAELAHRVVEGDARVNEAQREISEAVVSTIATQSPVARDLRFLMALDHVAIELERIGDHASGIAKQALRIGLEAPLPALADVARMGEVAADQVRAVIEALIDVDEARARLVAAGDDEIDHGYRMVFADVVEQMRHDPRTVERGTRLILAAHWIERIGDRVTNVAEDVVYLTSGAIEDLN
jgi:phosphate transport system protein